MKLSLAILGFTANALRISHPHTDEELERLGLAGCQCLDDNGIVDQGAGAEGMEAMMGMDGMGTIQSYNGQCMLVDLPENYGESTCEAWDMGLAAAGCDGDMPGEYCSQTWCYVSAECQAGHFSNYNPEIKYSYLACGHDFDLAPSGDGKSVEECVADAALAAAQESAAAAEAARMAAQEAAAAAQAAAEAA